MFLSALVVSAAAMIYVAADVSTQTPNRCPQPTKEKPIPPPFYYGDPDNCHVYYNCAFGKAYLQSCAPGTVWSDVFYGRVAFNGQYDTCTRDNAHRECASRRGKPLLIGHPQHCQRYYNCSNTAPSAKYSFLKMYEDECKYSSVFDIIEKKCQSFKIAHCGPLRVPDKDPCDYIKNQCRTSRCEPCPSRRPSCVALSDGVHAHPLKLWSPYYIFCDTERLVSVRVCSRSIFSPIKNACVPASEVPRVNW